MIKRWLLILIAVLQIGCTVTMERSKNEVSPLISTYSWQQLERVLKKSPSRLHRAIRQEAEAHLIQANEVPSVSVAYDKETRVETTLHNLFSHSDNPVLMPNDEFNELHKIVTGNQSLSANSFNMAFTAFLTDPSFNCKQPNYAHYFQLRYGNNQFTNRCQAEIPFYVASRYDGIQPVWIDPMQIHSIHFLFAGNGESMASRFGHVALRIVICPKGQFTGAVCNANLFEHLVVGFMAHIDEFEIDTLKALSGHYKTYLFANQFMDVYQDYAISEFREIYSLPLRLNKGQREQVVRRLSEIHWRFTDDYNFFTKNCTTFLQEALKILLPEFSTSEKIADNYIRPDHFFAAAKDSLFTEGNKLVSLEAAEQEGYYFSSTKPFYDKALGVVQNAMNTPIFSDIESYLLLNPIKRMDYILRDNDYLTKLTQNQYLFEAQLMLEELAVIRSERFMLAEGARYFKQLNDKEKISEIHQQLDTKQTKIFDDCLLLPINQVTEPILRLSGIPDKSDIPPTKKISDECHTRESKKQLKEILDSITVVDIRPWQNVKKASRYLEANISNVTFLKEL